MRGAPPPGAAPLATVLLALAACGGPLEITQAPVPYAATRALNERGSTTFTVRTQHRRAGITSEVAGVPCTLAADGFGSRFTTPATLQVPNLRSRLPAAILTCTNGGDTRTLQIEPYNRTVSDTHLGHQDANPTTGLFRGLGSVVGALTGALELAGRDPAADVYSYRDTVILFEPLRAA